MRWEKHWTNIWQHLRDVKSMILHSVAHSLFCRMISSSHENHSHSKRWRSDSNSNDSSWLWRNFQDELTNISAAVKKYKICRNIILNKSPVKRTKFEYVSILQLLVFHEKTIILQFVDRFIELNFFFRLFMLREKVELILRERRIESNLKKHWLDRFLIKHFEYRSKFLRHLDQKRQFNSDSIVFQQWFELIRKTCDHYHINCENIYNMNEKNFMMKMKNIIKWISSSHVNLIRLTSFLLWLSNYALISHELRMLKTFFSKIIVRRNVKNVFFVHSENRKWVTTIQLMSSRDRIFRSLMIFSEKIIQKTWINTWSYSMYEIFNNDWIDNELDLAWLKDLFHFETAHLSDRRLLIINDHASHVFVEFVKFCWQMNIVSLCLSFHTTHYLQSLNVDCFVSLNKICRKKLKEKNKTNVMHIIKFDFFTFLKKARQKIMTEAIMMSSWAKIDMILWMIFHFVSNSLTNSDLYFYDSSQMLNQLTIKISRFNISSSSIEITNLNKTLINKQKIETLIELLNEYTSIYKLKLSRIKKTMNTMIVITILAQDSIKLLFKTNMTKKTRKKKTKEDDRKRYKFAYERVLTETVIKKHKENEIKRMKEVTQKKKTFETKKMISIERKRVHMKEMISRKRKREEARIIKKLEKASKFKRAYRRRLLHSSISVQTSTILKNSTLSMKKIEARRSTPSWEIYVYE